MRHHARISALVFLLVTFLAASSGAQPISGAPSSLIKTVPIESITIRSLSTEQQASLAAFKLNLMSAPLNAYDLKAYQTSVKDQNPRGSCSSFASLGAVEAAYIRKYGSHPLNRDTDGPSKYLQYGITNDCLGVCQGNPSCWCEELDLSEEYFIHMVHSMQPTGNPSVNHENISSFCGNFDGAEGSMIDGDWMLATEVMRLPRERFAPYFGNGNVNIESYGTKHSHNDMASVAEQAGIRTVASGDNRWCDAAFYKANPTALTQQMVDNFEYDPRYIPLDARKNAIYGASQVQFLTGADTSNTTFLEDTLYADHEIKVGVTLDGIDCDWDRTNFYKDGTPLQMHADGNVICKYFMAQESCLPCNKSCSSTWNNCNWDLQTGKWVYAGSGHALLIVAYDRTNQRFLLKNSWGSYRPYWWVPYDFIMNRSSSGLIVLDVSQPARSREALWVGKWKMDHDGWLGNLVLRRTRNVSENLGQGNISTDISIGTSARLGTYYDGNGIARRVNGFIDSSMAHANLYIDFGIPEGPPDPKGTPVNLFGQNFGLEMFESPSNAMTFGNYASGKTTWNNVMYGALLSRPSARLHHLAGNFDINKWKDSFTLYYSGGSAVSFDVTNIGPLGGGGYYPVTVKYDGAPGSAGIDSPNINHLFFFGGFYSDLYYHTHETGLMSGMGFFGVRKAFTLDRMGVFRGGSWVIEYDGNNVWNPGADQVLSFGLATDKPVRGDWKGLGRTTVGVFRGGSWVLDMSGNGKWDGPVTDRLFAFGLATDMPVTGDWNGDGKTKVGVFRNGTWVLDYNGNGIWNPGVDKMSSFGVATDIPVTGDWNGDGRTKIGVFRGAVWYLDFNGNGVWDGCAIDRCYTFGLATDIPVAGDWNGDGKTEIGVFRNGSWILDSNGNGTWNGAAVDKAFSFGLPTDRPVSGNW